MNRQTYLKQIKEMFLKINRIKELFLFENNNSIIIRNKNGLRGALSITECYLANEMPVFLVSITDKEKGDMFKEFIKDFLQFFLAEIYNHIKEPFAIVGDEVSWELLKAQLNKNKKVLQPLLTEQLELLDYEDADINWGLCSDKFYCDDLFYELNLFNKDFNNLLSCIPGNPTWDNGKVELFKPFRTVLRILDNRAIYSYNHQNKEYQINIKNQIFTQKTCENIDNYPRSLLDKYILQSRLEWLVSKHPISTVYNFVNLHISEEYKSNSNEQALTLQLLALTSGWSIGELEIALRVLLTNRFIKIVERMRKRGTNKTLQIKNIIIFIKRNSNQIEVNFTIYHLKLQITLPNQKKFDMNDVSFSKIV